MSIPKSRRLEKQMVQRLRNLTAGSVAALSADRTCQRCTFERRAAKAHRSTARPQIRVRCLCLKTSKMLFFFLQEQQVRTQLSAAFMAHMLERGEMFCKQWLYKQCLLWVFSIWGRWEAGREQSAELRSNLFSWAVYFLSLYLALFSCFTFQRMRRIRESPWMNVILILMHILM